MVSFFNLIRNESFTPDENFITNLVNITVTKQCLCQGVCRKHSLDIYINIFPETFWQQ